MVEPLNAGAPEPLGAGGATITIIDGTTFCLSESDGDIRADSQQGLFVRDTRIVSTWTLLLDDAPVQQLAVRQDAAGRARFVSRRRPAPQRADSTVLVVRERQVGHGMVETITLENLGREPTTLSLTLRVAADFADLFAVKEGRAAHSEADTILSAHDLVIRSGAEQHRGVRIRADGEFQVGPRGLVWRIIIPARAHWNTTITVDPVAEEGGQDWPGPVRAAPVHQLRDDVEPLRQTIRIANPEVAAVIARSLSDLDALRIVDAPTDRSFIAAGAPWFMTLFGRDSLLTAWMTLPLDPGIAVGTLQILAALQGRQCEPRTEEEPGRILHELRGGPATADALGGAVYYGTIDATPLFVMLCGEALRWGVARDVLATLLPAVDAAIGWLRQYGDRDGDGFIEYERATDRGLINQGWKDSFDAINDADGHLAEAPIALCEVQGYTYAALAERARLADAFGDPETARRCRQEANQLKHRFNRRFWLPEHGWFASALDGRKRPVDALTSNVGHCLWTGIVAERHAAALVATLSGPDMDSGFGLRTLSRRMGAYNPMSYHNGSVWPHDTAICIAGLSRYRHVPGAAALAHRLAAGLFAAAADFNNRLPELFCGFDRSQFSPAIPYPTSCSPQAWASAAPLLVLRSLLGLQADAGRRQVRLEPDLPADWGEVRLDHITISGRPVRLSARGRIGTVEGLPDTWRRPPAPRRAGPAIARQVGIPDQIKSAHRG